MKCFKFTIDSDNGTNGLYRVNSQQNHELTKLLNEQGKYKIVISKFILGSLQLDTTNIINEFIINVRFNNINIINSYKADNTDNVILRVLGNVETYKDIDDNEYIYLMCNYEPRTFENATCLMSCDNIIKDGYINVKISYSNPMNDNTEIPPVYNPIFIIEFFIIFD
jgi:hypothetical protein